MALTEFFHADAETNVHPLLVLWYFIYSLWRYLCSCTHIISRLWSITKAFSSSSWPILFKVLTLNVVICIVLLHFSYFCFSLSSVADFFEHWGQSSNLSRTRPFFTCTKGNAVWTCGLSMSRGNLSMAYFYANSGFQTLIIPKVLFSFTSFFMV